MKERFNVIWIDDEWDKMDQFIVMCREIHQIYLEPFRTSREGMNALENNLDKWDAVILDANVFNESENEVADLIGLRNSVNKLNQLKSKKDIPYFISTGQKVLFNDKTFNSIYDKFYIKEKDDDKLIQDLKDKVKSSSRWQIRNRYSEVFSSMDKMNFPPDIQSTFTDVLETLHEPSSHPDFNAILYYNQLRKMVEYLFRAANAVGLIPDECTANKVNLKNSLCYLKGDNVPVINLMYTGEGKRIIPTHIEWFLNSILYLGNINSHTTQLDDEEEQRVNEFLYKTHSNYTIFALSLQMCEVVLWFSEYIKSHPDKVQNLRYCFKSNKYEGAVMMPEKDEKGRFHCEGCLVMLNDKFWNGGRIKLKEIQPNTSTSKALYPYYAKYENAD
jgi:hypothetical protein